MKKKKKKAWVGIFKNMGGNFPGGSFPDAILTTTATKGANNLVESISSFI